MVLKETSLVPQWEHKKLIKNIETINNPHKKTMINPRWSCLETGMARIPQINPILYYVPKLQLDSVNYNKSYCIETIASTDGQQWQTNNILLTAKYLMLYKKLQFFNTYVSVSCSYVYISDKSELFLWHFPDLMILIFYINNKSKHAVEDPTVTVKWSVMLDSLSCSFTSISFLTIHTNKSYSKQDQTVNTWTYLLLSFKCFHSINWSIPRFFVDF